MEDSTAIAHESMDSVTITDIEMSGDVQMAWDQQTGETGLQYKKFRTYLEMAREDRTVGASFKRYGELYAGKEGVVIGAITQWKELSLAQRWMDRARAYDRWVDVKVMEKLANQRLSSLVEIADLGAKLRRTAAKALDSLRTVIKIEDTDPETGDVTYALRSAISAGDIAKLAQTGIELEQLAIGAPTSRNSIVPAGEDSTLAGMADAKTLFTKKIQEITARRQQATTSARQLDAGVSDTADTAGEVLAQQIDSTDISSTRSGTLGDADYTVEIDTETPSPEDIRLAKIRAGEL